MGGSRGLAAATAAAIMLSLFIPASAPADDSLLDPAFAQSGRFRDDLPLATVVDSVIDAKGKLVIASIDTYSYPIHDVAWRIANGGQRDRSFGRKGTVVVSDNADRPATTYLTSVATDQTNRIVLGGDMQRSTGTGGATETWTLTRLTEGGRVDQSFGAGGTVSTDLPATSDRLYDVAIDSAGRILVVGRSGDDTFVARYLENGSLDTTFGGGSGWVQLGLGLSHSQIRLDSLQRIVVAGDTTQPPLDSPPSDIAVLRLTPDGLPDPAFAGGQPRSYDLGDQNDRLGGIVVDPGDGVTLAAHAGSRVVVMRLDASGSPDLGFGSEGRVDLTDPQGFRVEQSPLAFSAGVDVAVTSAGRILVAGSVERRGRPRFVLLALTPDGQIDSGFAPSGRAYAFFPYTDAYAIRLHLDRQSRPVVVGTSIDESYGDDDPLVSVARFGGPCGAATIRGTDGPDRLVGTRRRDVIDALGGKDTIRGRDGRDVLCGGRGNDRIRGGARRDVLWGGPGDDELQGGPGKDRTIKGLGLDHPPGAL